MILSIYFLVFSLLLFVFPEQDCTKMREQQSSYESEITVKKQELQTMSELLQNTQGHNSILKVFL